MEPINGWNGIEEAGSFEKIELGGHICVIKGVRDERTKAGGKMLVIAFDFSQNDRQHGYYESLFQSDKKKNADAKWRGTMYQNYGSENSNPYFKSMLGRIMESNTGYQWDWDEKGLKGKLFGGVMGREEYVNDKGESKFATKCMQIRAVQGIEEVPVPEDKLIKKDISHSSGFTLDQASHDLQIDDDDLPF